MCGRLSYVCVDVHLRFTYGEAVFLTAVSKALQQAHFIVKMYKPCGIGRNVYFEMITQHSCDNSVSKTGKTLDPLNVICNISSHFLEDECLLAGNRPFLLLQTPVHQPSLSEGLRKREREMLDRVRTFLDQRDNVPRGDGQFIRFLSYKCHETIRLTTHLGSHTKPCTDQLSAWAEVALELYPWVATGQVVDSMRHLSRQCCCYCD